MRRYPFCLISLLLISALFFSACNPTRRVPDNRYLLVKKHILTDNNKVDKEDLNSIIKQKPNRKILGFLRFHLTVYNLVDPEKVAQKKQNKLEKITRKNEKRTKERKSLISTNFSTFGEWLLNIGEEPVMVDSMLTKKSSKQLALYLFKKGYFNAMVSDSTLYEDKRAQVYYMLHTDDPYTIRNKNYIINDSVLFRYVMADTINSLIKSGDNYDEDIISEERERVTKLLRNEGYFYFSKEFFHFAIDSALGNKEVNIKIEIKNPETKISGEKNTVIETRHKQYYIKNIYIQTNYNPQKPENRFKDTLVYNNFIFLNNGNLNYKPNIISSNIFIKSGELFQLKNLEETHQKLSDLKAFRFINIQFREENANDSELNCHIMLAPVIKQSFTIDPQAYNRSGSPGIEGNLVFINNNTFGGAEIFEVRLKGALEAQKTHREITNEENPKLFFFNTQEFGPEISLNIPKFLLPIKPERFSKYFTPKTTITASYNFQERLELIRRIGTLSFGYTWKESVTKKHFVYPAEINLVNIQPKPTLDNFLNSIENPFILNSFKSHITASSKYVYIYNNQGVRKSRDFHFFRGSIEGAGNFLRFVGPSVGFKKDTLGNYLIAQTPFAQYIKSDVDFRYYKIINGRSNLVFRTALGAGKPFKNLGVLPLEKSYFGGGSNSIRAWSARSLGPGSFRDVSTSNTLRIGDINLEGNIEYRFDIYKIFKGALFVDGGNIWLFREDKDREGGVFDPDKFVNEIAIGTGVGLRLDFSFFIFRLDLGIKVRDPMLENSDKWVIKHVFDRKWDEEYRIKYGSSRSYHFNSVNFGIGYPF